MRNSEAVGPARLFNATANWVVLLPVPPEVRTVVTVSNPLLSAPML